MAEIKIPTPLRTYTDGEPKVSVDGHTIRDALDNLVDRYPELQPHLFKDGELRNFVNIFLGNEDVRQLDGLETELQSDSDLRIIPSIAGGCCC